MRVIIIEDRIIIHDSLMASSLPVWDREKMNHLTTHHAGQGDEDPKRLSVLPALRPS